MPIPQHTVAGPKSGNVHFKDIGGGLQLKSNRFNVRPEQMTTLKNFMLVEDGSLIGRRGATALNTTIAASTPLGAQRFYGSGGTANLFLVDVAGTVYKSSNGTSFSSSKTGFSSSATMWFSQYLTFTYVATSSDAPQKFDGTTWSTMGIAAPSVGPTAAAGAAGVLNGTYRFYYSNVTATIESNTSPASSPDLVLTNQQASLSNIAAGPAGTTKRNIYGFLVGTSSTPQLIGTISDNTTTTFTVTTDQSSWTTTNQTTNNPPVTGPWITVQWKNRLWKGGDPNNPQRLYFSQIFLPEAWPTAFFIDLPFEQGDQITAIFVLGDLLLVFGNNQLFYIIGDTPFSFIVKQSYSQSGCPSPWAIARVENTAVFLARFGVFAFDGALTIPLSADIEPLFTGVLPQFASMNYLAASRATLAYYDRLKAIVTSFPTTGGAISPNDTTVWYFFRRKGWSQDTRTSSFLIPASGIGDTGNLYSWEASTAILDQWDTGYTDYGSAITGTFTTGIFDAGNPKTTKGWSWITTRAQPGNFTLTLTASVDQGQGSDSVNLSLSKGAVYGTGTYGTSTYGSDIDNFESRWQSHMIGRTCQLTGSIAYSAFVRIVELIQQADDFGTVRPQV